MAQLFADEDFPFPVVEFLRTLSHDVMTTRDAGLAGQGTDDSVILATATQLDRAVLTMNRRDYFALHAADSNHAGIIACRFDSDVAALAGRIHAAITTLTALAGLLIRINRRHSSQKP